MRRRWTFHTVEKDCTCGGVVTDQVGPKVVMGAGVLVIGEGVTLRVTEHRESCPLGGSLSWARVEAMA